jgi:hypothetical protein
VEASGVRIHHPNREKPESKATKAAVALLLVASAALIAIVFIGGFSELAGAQIVAVAWILIYLVMAYFVVRWSRGVLPMAAAMGILFTSFMAVAAPAWFARDKPGLEDPLLPSGLLGLLTLVIIALQVLLILFAMRGFRQEWNVEIERHDDDRGYDESDESYESEHSYEYDESRGSDEREVYEGDERRDERGRQPGY